MYQFPTEPRGVWSVIGGSLRLYKKVYKRVFLISLLISIVFVLIGIPAVIMHGGAVAAGVKPKLGLGEAIAFIAAPFVFLLVMSYLKATLVRFEGEISQNIPTKVKSVALFALRKYLIVLVASILVLIATGVGLVIVVLPGIFLAVLLMFAPVGILLDNEDVFSSIKRSAKLVWGHWWRTLAVLLIPGIFNIIVFVLFRVITQYGFHLTTYNLWFYIINAIPILILEPWAVAVVLEQYYDLKLRYQRKPVNEVE